AAPVGCDHQRGAECDRHEERVLVQDAAHARLDDCQRLRGGLGERRLAHVTPGVPASASADACKSSRCEMLLQLRLAAARVRSDETIASGYPWVPRRMQLAVGTGS